MRHARPSRTGAVAFAAILTVALAACSGTDTGPAAAGTPDDGTGQDGAGSIVVYSTTMPAVQERLAEAFTEKTGIEVESLRMQSTALASRFVEEQQAGQHAVDVLTLNDEIFLREISDTGMIADLSDYAGVDALPDEWRAGSHFVTLTMSPYKVGYNTDLVAPEDVPETIQDLLRPEFKGEILIGDPRTNPELSAKTWSAIIDTHGEDLLRDLAAQDLRVVASTTPGFEDLAAGEAALIVTAMDMNLTPYEDTGAPVAVADAIDPTSALPFFLAVPATVPNPEGARAWVEFVLGEEGQAIINEDIGISPLGDDIPGSLPTPDNLVFPDPETSMERMPKILELLGIEG